MSTKLKAGLIVLAAVLLIALGYGISSWRRQSWIAGYEEREQTRLKEIAEKEAEQNQLRGENKTLREENAQLSAKSEAIEANIKERGGSIAAETKKMEAIDIQLAKDEQVIKAPADKCVRCKRFSDVALAQKLIDRPLSCEDECK
jgi:uncharacterized protein HemX